MHWPILIFFKHFTGVLWNNIVSFTFHLAFENLICPSFSFPWSLAKPNTHLTATKAKYINFFRLNSFSHSTCEL